MEAAVFVKLPIPYTQANLSAFSTLSFMNKLSFSLAFAVLALVACSDDSSQPPPSIAELCNNSSNISRDCLLGTWSLDSVLYLENGNQTECVEPGTLKLEASGYEFDGEYYDRGTWTVNEKSITRNSFELSPPSAIGTIEVSNSGYKMSITSNNPGSSVFSVCNVNSPRRLKEIYKRR
jgi:hypothetical protein